MAMMTTEAQAPRLEGLPQVLSAIISAARRRAGVAALSDAALADEIRDWQRILAPIPTDRLEECELHAIRTRSVKALLQPQELLGSLERDSRRGARRGDQRRLRRNREWCECPYCDQGWQTYAYRSASGNENTAARPCACEATPMEIRSLEPLREPQWQKRKHSAIWERVT